MAKAQRQGWALVPLDCAVDTTTPAGEMPADIVERIECERAEGMSLPAIATGLNADGVPTAQGGRRWYPSTVRAVLVGRGGRRAPAR